MDRRIFGVETEYGLTCSFRGQRRLSPDEVARYLFRGVVSWGRSSNVFLRNGSRLYLDVGTPHARAPALILPEAVLPSTPPRSATAWSTLSRTTRRASGSWRGWWRTPAAGCARRGSAGGTSHSNKKPTPPGTPHAGL